MYPRALMYLRGEPDKAHLVGPTSNNLESGLPGALVELIFTKLAHGDRFSYLDPDLLPGCRAARMFGTSCMPRTQTLDP